VADLAILTAVSGAGWESQLVSAIDKAPGGLYVARRCVDVADLLATSAAGFGSVAMLAPDFRGLDRDVIARLGRVGVAVVGVVEPGSADPVDRLRRIGISTVVPADISPELLAATLITAVDVREAATGEGDGSSWTGDETTGAALGAAEGTGLKAAGQPHSDSRGELVAVWGAYGAPGRTTVAINLAGELASLGMETLLVDGDTYGASIAQSMGLLDEAPGLAGAARSANSGGFDRPAIARYARQVMPGLRVLSGISRPSRWSELRGSSLEVVFDVARSVARFTVVDVGFCLESDDDIEGLHRNAATLTTLLGADRIIAVGTGDAIGLGRLVRGLSDIDELRPDARVDVVINRVRRTFAGRDPEREITGALNRYASIKPVAFVFDDRAAVDAAVAQGLTLAESAPNSPARQSIKHLAMDIAGMQASADNVASSGRKMWPSGWKLVGPRASRAR
jgi:MinD-like ATPase involved in chromosome partitioning or flagellar assembly